MSSASGISIQHRNHAPVEQDPIGLAVAGDLFHAQPVRSRQDQATRFTELDLLPGRLYDIVSGAEHYAEGLQAGEVLSHAFQQCSGKRQEPHAHPGQRESPPELRHRVTLQVAFH
jgi:hypothetical protein